MAKRIELPCLEHQQSLRSARAMGLFFVIVCLVIAFWAWAPGRWRHSPVFEAAVGAGVALVLLGIALRHLWRGLRLARLRLLLDREPAVGRPFTARLELPADGTAGRQVRAELSCRALRWSAAPDAEVEETVLWQATQEAVVSPSAAGAAAEFRFDVPAAQPASDLPSDAAWSRDLGSRTRPSSVQPDQRYHEWQLVLTIGGPGSETRRTSIVAVRPPSHQRVQETAGRRQFEPGKAM
jgi:hypothetical protein